MTPLLTKLHADLELAQRATAGPWTPKEDVGCFDHIVKAGDYTVADTWDGGRQEKDNAQFIAASRLAWPRTIKALIVAIEALQKLDHFEIEKVSALLGEEGEG